MPHWWTTRAYWWAKMPYWWATKPYCWATTPYWLGTRLYWCATRPYLRASRTYWWDTTVVFTAWGSTIFKKWQFCVFLDNLHLRASYAMPRRSFVYKNMVKCFSDNKNVFFQFFSSIFDQKSTFLAQNELKNALLGGTPKIAIFSNFCGFIATHQTTHHTM